MVGSLAFFVFTLAKEERRAVGQGVVELLEGVSGHCVLSKPGLVGVVRLLAAILALISASVKAQYDKSCLSVVIRLVYVSPQIE
jgi:hypothetical protein